MKRLAYIFTLLIFTVLFSLCTFAGTPAITGSAAVRTEQPVGVRIKAVVDAETANSNSTVEYGFIAVRKVFLTAAGLDADGFTLDCGVYYTKGVARGIVGDNSVDHFFDKTDTEVFFAGYIHGIEPRYYSEFIVVRPYIIFDDGVRYGNPVEVSIYGVAKQTFSDKDAFNALSKNQQDVLISIITAVDGEPYYIDRKDFRIVLSTSVIKNANPTYSVSYDLFNPFTGEVERRVIGRKKSKDYGEISSMLLEAGMVVPVYDGVVQDTTDGYVSGDYTKTQKIWISDCDTEGGTITLSQYDSTLKCKDCVKEYISESSSQTAFITDETPVYVFDGSFDGVFEMSSVAEIQSRKKELLCFNSQDGGTVFSDYVKAYVSVDGEGNSEYILVTVNGGENAALDEKCLQHTCFTVDFYVEDVLYKSQSIIYGKTPELPDTPEKEGHTFIYWIYGENPEAVNVTETPIYFDTEFFAVFEINSYTVSYYLKEDTLHDVQTVVYSECPPVPETPALSGNDFVGWAVEANGETVDLASITVTKDMSLYAVFKPKPNDPNLIEIMTRGLSQLKKIRITQNSKNDIARDLIVECMTYVLADANNGIYIDRNYIYNTYTSLAKQIKKAIKEDMTKEERSAFVNILTNVRNIDKDVQDFLVEYFDIDMSAI